MPDKTTITKQIKNYALEIGFDDIGIARSHNSEQVSNTLQKWIKNGYHADMNYMQNNIDLRSNPQLLFPEAKSVIVVILNYNISTPESKSKYKVARFAHLPDYHYIIKEKLTRLLDYIKTLSTDTEGQISVDTLPIAERYWAVQAGLGFLGQNTMFIHPKLGSLNFIGTLITNLELEYDTPNTQKCIGCGKCIEHCPNKALIKPYVLDARLCVSYQTIEMRTQENLEDKVTLENYIFGCDICNLVCPHNREIPPAKPDNFSNRPQIEQLTDSDWQTMGSGKFKRLFSRSPLRRAGLSGIRRNIGRNKK